MCGYMCSGVRNITFGQGGCQELKPITSGGFEESTMGSQCCWYQEDPCSWVAHLHLGNLHYYIKLSSMESSSWLIRVSYLMNKHWFPSLLGPLQNKKLPQRDGDWNCFLLKPRPTSGGHIQLWWLLTLSNLTSLWHCNYCYFFIFE